MAAAARIAALSAARIAALSKCVSEPRLARMAQVLASRTSKLHMALEDVTNGANTAAILRSCENLGVQNVHFFSSSNRTLRSPKPALKRRQQAEVSKGAHRWLTLTRHAGGVADFGAAARRGGWRVLGADASSEAAAPIASLDLHAPHADADGASGPAAAAAPIVLLFGNEGKGLSAEALALCGELGGGTFRLPSCGLTRSYNVSVAAAMALFHCASKGLLCPPSVGLGQAERDELLLGWLERDIRGE